MPSSGISRSSLTSSFCNMVSPLTLFALGTLRWITLERGAARRAPALVPAGAHPLGCVPAITTTQTANRRMVLMLVPHRSSLSSWLLGVAPRKRHIGNILPACHVGNALLMLQGLCRHGARCTRHR